MQALSLLTEPPQTPYFVRTTIHFLAEKILLQVKSPKLASHN